MSLYKYNLFVMKNIVIMDSEFQVDVECGLIISTLATNVVQLQIEF